MGAGSSTLGSSTLVMENSNSTTRIWNFSYKNQKLESRHCSSQERKQLREITCHSSRYLMRQLRYLRSLFPGMLLELRSLNSALCLKIFCYIILTLFMFLFPAVIRSCWSAVWRASAVCSSNAWSEE